MKLPLWLWAKLRQIGLPDEDIEYINQGWALPVLNPSSVTHHVTERDASRDESVTDTASRYASRKSRDAERAKRYRARKTAKNTDATNADSSRDVTNVAKSVVYLLSKENKTTTPQAVTRDASRSRGARLSGDWSPSPELVQFAWREYGLSAESVRRVTDEFRDYWVGVPGQKGVKLDWDATFRNWIRRNNATSKKANGHGGKNDEVANLIRMAERNAEMRRKRAEAAE